METNLKNFKLLWITDPHLNFVHEEAIKSFCRKIKEKEPNAVVITGDIAEAPSIVSYLGFMDLNLENKCPIFFVLGNHDYYHGTIEGVREVMERLFTYDEASKMILEPRLGWLSSSGVVPLTEKTALIGHDGWYDGQYADWYKSKVYLNDYLLIGELADRACPVRELRFAKINELAKEAAEIVRNNLSEAFKTFEHVYVATHVSPFRENSTYEGKISDDDWMPHFSSKHMGDMLLEMADNYQHKQITVLCGHSHGGADNQITHNIRCVTGEARYRHPRINHVFEVE